MTLQSKVLEATRAGRRNTLTTDDGVELFYRDWGQNGDTPLVFLAGWGLNTDIWGALMQGLVENGRRCIAYDRRGHGKSSDPGGDYSFDRLADDLAAVLEGLDLTGVTLVGHSMGAGEIVRCLSRHGSDRVAKVVMVGAALPCLGWREDNPTGAPPEMLAQMRSVFMTDFPGWMAANARPFVAPETSEATIDWVKAMMTQASFQALIETNRSLTAEDFRGELARLDLPVLMLHGDADASANLETSGRATERLLPQGRLEVYPGGPHGLMLTHKDRMRADIAAFVG
ncbi:MAG TPA: alpha/beta hydrolase [Caulobacteraceae bacterium]|jgi:pimeloyl-ACP methyl ester carboxylesterase